MARRRKPLKSFIPQPNYPELSVNANSYHVVSSFLAHKASKLNMARLANRLKNLANNDLASDALKNLFRMMPSVRKVIWGNSFPTEVAQLGNGENCYFFEPQSLEHEINWTIFGLKPYRNQLKEFVVYRDKTEHYILHGNYFDAKELLKQSVKQFGYSVWYYEMMLTIDGLQDHISECFSLLTQVNEAYKKADRYDIVPIILQDLCNRSINRSPLQYDNLLLSHFKRNRTNSNRFDYYLYRLNYYQYYGMENLAEMVEMEHMQSAVDRYTMLLYVLRSGYITKSEQRPSIIRYAKQLYRLTADSQLLPFLAIEGKADLPDCYYDTSFIAILDKYYTGCYQDTADLCRQYLERDPSNLYVIKLYCRSLMFLGKGYQAVTNSNSSLLHQITFNIYKVMVEKESKDYLEELGSLLKKIYGLRIAAALDHFVKSEQREHYSDMMAYFTLSQFDPFFIRVFDDDKRQISYLDRGLHHVPGSVAIMYRKQCVERDITSDSPVVAYIRDVDTAKIIFERGDYEQALNLWRHVFETNHGSTPTAQTAVEYIFRSLVALGVNYRQEAVRFYTDCYIENRSYVSKVATADFMNDIKQSRYNGLKNDLDLMLFVFLNADKYPQKQFVLERYCRYERATYPSELISRLSRKGNPRKVELFFSILLTDDILYHHYKLRSTSDVLDEKLKIVNFLKTKYPDNKTYSAIFTELMHEIVAYRGMVKLDDSKIYVNEDAVMKYELCNIEPVYERFCKQAALAREGHSVLLVGDISLTGLKEIIKDEASYSNDAVADVAKELFSMIRRAFLKSRFGLGTYLSTRIRHGVFDGEMRSFLEQLDIILSTDHGKYVADNTRWHRRYHLDSTARETLNNALTRFSYDTDHLISTFKDSVIQIRVDNNDENGGLFCYEQPQELVSTQLMKFEGESKNAQEFCHKVIGWLWQITEQCLENVRQKVQTELRPSYTANLLQLERCIEQLNSHATLQTDLHTSINKAREELNTRLVKVEKWFYRQEAKLEDFRLSDHINMAFDTIGKYSPDIMVKLNISRPDPEPVFKAQYSASMFDLLTIFFSNIFKYSREEIERTVQLNADIDENFILHLHLENKLRDGVNESEQNRDFQDRISDEKLIQKEGGSGLAKAMNIIRYDFGDTRNTYTIVASEGRCLIDIQIHLSHMIA